MGPDDPFPARGTRRAGIRRLFTGLVLAALSSAGTLGAIELAAGGLYPRVTTSDQRDRIELFLEGTSMAWMCTPHPYALYMPVPGLWQHGYRQHNSLGFRGQDVSPEFDVFRIACLGGSTTYGWAVRDPANAWPLRLEAQLRETGRDLEVLNAGLPMGSTAEALSTLQFRVLPLRPKVVILHAGLDDAFPELMPRYRPDYSHDRIAWTCKDSILQRMLLHSDAYAIVRLRQGLEWTTFLTPDHWFWEAKSTGNFEAAREPQRYLAFENNVRSIIAICAQYDMQLVLSPTTLAPGASEKLGALYEAYETNVRILRELADEHEDDHVHWVDMRELQGPPGMFRDFCHVDVNGENAKATIFKDFLLSNGLVP